MATPRKPSPDNTASLDRIAEVLDIELAAAAERVQSADRSAARARQRYTQLIEARSELRALR